MDSWRNKRSGSKCPLFVFWNNMSLINHALFFWPAIAYRSSLDKDRRRCPSVSPPLSAPQPYTATFDQRDVSKESCHSSWY
jgi:hypothetical protein